MLGQAHIVTSLSELEPSPSKHHNYEGIGGDALDLSDAVYG